MAEETVEEKLAAQGFAYYERKGKTMMRPYKLGDNLADVSISAPDKPQLGGMIAVNVDDPTDKWYVSKAWFEANYHQKAWPVATAKKEKE